MRTRTGSVFRFLFVFMLAFLLVPLLSLVSTASAQPDPAVTPAQLHVESTYVNLSATPAFRFAVAIPTLFQFRLVARNGQQLLQVLAISRVDSLQSRIRRAASYQAERPGIFTPLIEPPNTEPILGYVDRLEFRRALEQALRDVNPERRLSYHRRLSSHST